MTKREKLLDAVRNNPRDVRFDDLIRLVKALGFDLVWFGILYTITCQIAYITPPFGYNLFLMRAMAPPEITLVDIYRSIVPFFFLMVLTVVILMLFPQIALWLPGLYKGS